MTNQIKNAPITKENKKKAKSGFRLLPLVIFFCTLMLSLRVGVLWRSFVVSNDKPPVFSVNEVLAKQEEKEDLVETKSPVSQLAASKEAPKNVTSDKTFSQSELDILQSLAKRREELDARESDLNQKMGLLKAAEAQIEGKIAKLKELEMTIKELIGQYDIQEKAKMDNLVKIYSTMKPKEAARLFDTMDMDLLVRIFEKMKEAKSAPILALMTSEKATALTIELATRRRLPTDDDRK
ncbi:MAG: hypothetical protein MJ250_05615 [Alphaproteobacteria bacterium]|nr:hypothetical protein [Alphaproteobacteria bacterium]